MSNLGEHNLNVGCVRSVQVGHEATVEHAGREASGGMGCHDERILGHQYSR